MRASAAKRAKAITKHGMSRNRIYKLWIEMIQRCCNPKDRAYPSYGARGISVCEEWVGPQGFETFLKDVGRRPSDAHSLDRIDNDGNYEPGNVRWATPKQQARNTRRNRHITALGETLTLAEWSERSGIKRETIAMRLRCGWSTEKAVSHPTP
jgi:hypothetical protein